MATKDKPILITELPLELQDILAEYDAYLERGGIRATTRLQKTYYLKQYLEAYGTELTKEQVETHIRAKNQARNHYAALKDYARMLREKQELTSEQLEEICSIKKITNTPKRRTKIIDGIAVFFLLSIPLLKYTKTP